MARMGLGYGFVPELQAGAELKTGALMDLAPERFEDVNLYWHHWAVQSPVMARLCSAIRDGAALALAGIA
jgi:LysR family transcriptional regulator (chromosome initiation inhibitor)